MAPILQSGVEQARHRALMHEIVQSCAAMALTPAAIETLGKIMQDPNAPPATRGQPGLCAHDCRPSSQAQGPGDTVVLGFPEAGELAVTCGSLGFNPL